MNQSQNEKAKDPLHGITLEAILTELVAHYGWERLGEEIEIRCFVIDPSISSSLKFLRRTEWARKKVEKLFIRCLDSPGSFAFGSGHVPGAKAPSTSYDSASNSRIEVTEI
ncbi:MAG: VF530 family protein [Proteobacteria bacterium]|nr:VF530 family protein [Pseudomonadota bacterium]